MMISSHKFSCLENYNEIFIIQSEISESRISCICWLRWEYVDSDERAVAVFAGMRSGDENAIV